MHIKPCPFCRHPGAVEHDRDGLAYVECQSSRCGIAGPGFSATDEQAIRRWNERGDDPVAIYPAQPRRIHAPVVQAAVAYG